MKLKYVFVICLLSFLLQACQQHEQKLHLSFYHWKTSLHLSASEKDLLSKRQVKLLYVHLFDVVWDANQKAAIPAGVLSSYEESLKEQVMVPVVFISNEVLKKSDSTTLNTLSTYIVNRIESMSSKLDVNPVKEIQIDCDWSESTRANYFFLLKSMKNHSFLKGKLLSCTIRLHQIKYRSKTGIPPVDKGLLMCYNMDNVYAYATKNSILSIPVMNQYLVNQESYPLDLDFALPLFSWAVVFDHQKFALLINEVNEQVLQTQTAFQFLSDHRYLVLKDTLLQKQQVFAGEELRIECPTEADILEAKKCCSKIVKNKEINVVLYHLDSLTISRYSPNFYQSITQ